MSDDFSQDQQAMDRAKHQLTEGVTRIKTEFSQDQLAAAGLAEAPRHYQEAQQPQMTLEQAYAMGLIARPAPPGAYQGVQGNGLTEDPMDEIHRRAALEMERQRLAANPQMGVGTPAPPQHTYQPPAPPPPPAAMPDQQQQMMMSLMQQNQALLQQVQELTHMLANGAGQGRQQQPPVMREGRANRLTPERAEQELYSGRGLIG